MTAAWLTAAVFALTYLGLAVGKVPWLRMDRAGIALVGATPMLVLGLLTVDEAVGGDSIDYPTLMLLFGMMVVVGFLRLSGFLRRLTAGALDRVRSPLGLLAATVALAGNLTVLGSVANLIVVEKAAREGVAVTFWEHCKVGVPLTLLTLALGVAWLWFVPY